MTPVEALAEAGHMDWDDVVVVGFHKGNPELVVLSSHMSRQFSLWIAEHFKLYTMDRL